MWEHSEYSMSDEWLLNLWTWWPMEKQNGKFKECLVLAEKLWNILIRYLERSFSESVNKMRHVTETKSVLTLHTLMQTQTRYMIHMHMWKWKYGAEPCLTCFFFNVLPLILMDRRSFKVKHAGRLQRCLLKVQTSRSAKLPKFPAKGYPVFSGNLKPTINIQFTQQQKGCDNSFQTVGALGVCSLTKDNPQAPFCNS